MLRSLLFLLFCQCWLTTVYADRYYVSTVGIDDSTRDGQSAATAWASLAFACQQAPGGTDTIYVAAGHYTATQTAYPKSGTTILGEGTAITIIAGSASWVLTGTPRQFNVSNYLISAANSNTIRISQLTLRSAAAAARIDGGIHFERVNQVELDHLHFEEFSWAGAYLKLSNTYLVHDNVFLNASMLRDGYWGGSLFTRYFNDAQIYNNTITTTSEGGFGYKGSGHRNSKFYNNTVNVFNGFSIESAHENEYDFEIYDNHLNATISVPKGGQQADPANGGYTHSVWIHDNVINDSYTVEGPRNHMRVNNNFINITPDQLNGRVYTQHGGINYGPIWIHHNVVVGVDRGFIWKNNGTAEGIHVYHNTVYLADLPTAGRVLGLSNGTGVAGWTFQNNIIVCDPARPREFYRQDINAEQKVTATHNVLVNVTGAPAGNFVDVDPGLQLSGNVPFPYYEPGSASAYAVDRGLDMGMPYQGAAPDIGAFETAFVGALPVRWAQFDAKRTESLVVQLDWGTTGEVDNAYFVVERRTAQANWTSIGRVDGAGTTSEAQNYNFTDAAAPRELAYYRLRQTDLDGQTSNSPIRAVAATAEAGFQAFPNLTDGEVRLRNGGNRPVHLVDTAGQLLRTYPVGTERISLADLAPGVYYLRARTGVVRVIRP